MTRERQGYSLAFDYEINPNHRLTLQGIYSRRHATGENHYSVTYKDLDKAGPDDEGEIRQSAQIETKGVLPTAKTPAGTQQTMDFSLGGEHQFGKLSMNWGLLTHVPASPERKVLQSKQDFLGFDIVDAGPFFRNADNRQTSQRRVDGERGNGK